jgi:hypothetical protein
MDDRVKLGPVQSESEFQCVLETQPSLTSLPNKFSRELVPAYSIGHLVLSHSARAHGQIPSGLAVENL